MFDMPKFLNDFNIPFSNQGKNSAIGFINFNCPNPNCDDNSNHMGFSLEDNFCNCWKCGYHSLKQVVSWLLPYENSRDILKKYDTTEIIINHIHEKLNKKVNTELKLPGDELKPIHINYLKGRNFDPTYLETKYKLHGTTHMSNYKYRIIIPIYFNNKLVTFQTRAINDIGERYINCDPDNEIISIKHILYNIDNCKEDFCILTEGAFKVFRLGNNTLASLGKNYTKQQLKLLTRFKVVFIFFDPDSAGQGKAKKLSLELDSLGIKTFNIENEVAPDDMNEKNVILLHKEIKKALN